MTMYERLKDGKWHDTFGHVWDTDEPDGSDNCLRCRINHMSTLAVTQCDGPAWDLQVHEEPLPAEVAWELVEAELRLQFEQDMVDLKRKALEYGGADLLIMGKSMESLIPHGELDAQSRERSGIEMAIGFYLQGKVSRMFGAWNKGLEPSEDTLHDAETYCKMMRYVRRFGAWT